MTTQQGCYSAERQGIQTLHKYSHPYICFLHVTSFSDYCPRLLGNNMSMKKKRCRDGVIGASLSEPLLVRSTPALSVYIYIYIYIYLYILSCIVRPSPSEGACVRFKFKSGTWGLHRTHRTLKFKGLKGRLGAASQHGLRAEKRSKAEP